MGEKQETTFKKKHKEINKARQTKEKTRINTTKDMSKESRNQQKTKRLNGLAVTVGIASRVPHSRSQPSTSTAARLA